MKYVIRYKLDEYFYLSMITLNFLSGLWRGLNHAKQYDNKDDAYNDIDRLVANGCDRSELYVVSTQDIEDEQQ